MPDAYLTLWRASSICVCLKNIISGDGAIEMGGVIKATLFTAVLSAILLLARPPHLGFFMQQRSSVFQEEIQKNIFLDSSRERTEISGESFISVFHCFLPQRMAAGFWGPSSVCSSLGGKKKKK